MAAPDWWRFTAIFQIQEFCFKATVLPSTSSSPRMCHTANTITGVRHWKAIIRNFRQAVRPVARPLALSCKDQRHDLWHARPVARPLATIGKDQRHDLWQGSSYCFSTVSAGRKDFVALPPVNPFARGAFITPNVFYGQYMMARCIDGIVVARIDFFTWHRCATGAFARVFVAPYSTVSQGMALWVPTPSLLAFLFSSSSSFLLSFLGGGRGSQ